LVWFRGNTEGGFFHIGVAMEGIQHQNAISVTVMENMDIALPFCERCSDCGVGNDNLI
jgi:hypothetical protein